MKKTITIPGAVAPIGDGPLLWLSRCPFHAGIFLLSALCAFAACGDGGVEPSPPPDPPRPTTVTVTPATVRLPAFDATVQLAVEVRDQNGQTMAGTTVTWASSEASVGDR